MLSAPGVALAQEEAAQADDAAEEGGLNVIVVTAQKRNESQQDVPIAVTAVSSESLQAKGLTSVADIGGQAPNVTLKNTASFGGSSSILVSYIRGIGQNDFAFNLEPGVGVYVDGVYLARNIGANVDLLDLDRVEVLKGPQGTLFGRNTIGGALNIVTRDPGNDFRVQAEASTGRFNRIDFRGAVDVPLVPDLLTASFAVSTKHRDGYQRRIPYTGATDGNPIFLLATGGATGGPPNTNTDEAIRFPITNLTRGNDAGDVNQTAFRAKFLFTPSDNFRIRVIGDYLNVDQAAAPFSLLQVNQEAYVAIYNTCITGNAGIYAGVGALTGFGAGVANVCTSVRGNPGSPTGTVPSLDAEAGQHLPYDSRYVIRNADGSINPDVSYASGANFDKIDNYGINFQAEYDLTDNLQLKSITAYRRLDSEFGVDIGGAPFSALNPTFADKENQFSQELQLIGDLMNGNWNFVLGGYYFHEYGRHVDGVPFTGGLIQLNANWDYDTKSYAAFIHNNIDIIPDVLGITLGARYTKDDKRINGAQLDENNFAGKLFGLPPAAYPDPTDPYVLYILDNQEQSFDNFSYRIGAEYHVNRDVMIYASYATAFKGGGWTTRVTAPVLTPQTFGPEEAFTTEVGIKSQFLNNRVRLNLAAFNTEYNDIQLTFQSGSSPVTANGGDGRIRGIEAELNTAPTDNLSIDASFGYLDAEYQTVLPGALAAGLTTNAQFVNTPKWSAQAGASYRIDADFATITPRVDWTYASKVYNDEVNTELLSAPARSLFNGSVTFRTPDERFELQAGVANIFDKRFIQSGYTNALAIYSATYNRPREWFLTLRFRN
jgi:iron complex outermembrane receptor protein